MDQKDKFELNVLVDFQDYWRATFAYMFRGLRFKMLIAGAAIFPLFFLYLQIRYPYSEPAYELLIPLGAFAALLVLLYFNTKYLFSTKKFLQSNVCYVFSDDGVDAIAQSSPGWKSWAEIAKAYELKHDFLVFYTPERMYTIPKKCFQDESQIARFREILRSHLGSRAKLK